MIPHFYHRSINFGDCLSPYILEKISGGEEVVYTEQSASTTTIMAIGSILGTDVSNSIIWGNGFAWKYGDTEKITRPLQICAVRGKLTRIKLLENGIDCPQVYGDPALLLPRFYNNLEVKKKYKLGIIPHIFDYENVRNHYANTPDVTVIDFRMFQDGNTIENTIDKILECENVISGSLHGLIVANAYGIDSLWVEFSKKLQGDGFKFWDYFSCLDIVPYLAIKPLEMDLEEVISKIPKANITIDLDLLYNACPVLKK